MIPQLILYLTTISIALLYAVFDTFNNRNIPNKLAYASVIVAFAVTLTYQLQTIEYSIAIAAFIGAAIYLLYKAGYIGAGDGFEMAALSMLIPIQPNPIMGPPQLSTPFILSVFIASGVLTIIGVPVYYLLVHRKGRNAKIDINNVIKAAGVFIAYAAFFAFVYEYFNIGIIGAAIILLTGAFSAITILYNEKISYAMVSMVYPSMLEEGDIIATNMMSKRDIEYFKRKAGNFGRLVDEKLIKKISSLKKKVPVYRLSVPLSLPIFFGVIIALLFGNIFFYII